MKTILPFPEPSETSGFTRWDFLAILAALTLLTSLAYPALAGHKSGSDRATCLGNLRQIGTAFLTWGNSHNNRRPYWVPAPVGTYLDGSPKTGNGWQEFLSIRRELGHPGILACPADNKTIPATRWLGPGTSIQSLQGEAISYFIGLDTSPLLPQTFLAGDYNMTTKGIGPCATGINNALLVEQDTLWTNSIHGLAGNLLLNDGSAQHLSSDGLRQAARNSGDINIHTLIGSK